MTVGCCCVARCRHRRDARVQSMAKWKHPPRHGRRSVNSSIFCSLSSGSASGILARPCQSISCAFRFDLFHRTIWSPRIHTVVSQRAHCNGRRCVFVMPRVERIKFLVDFRFSCSIQIDSFDRPASGIRSTWDGIVSVVVAMRRNGESGNSVLKNFILLPNEFFAACMSCVCLWAALCEMKFENVQRMRWKFGLNIGFYGRCDATQCRRCCRVFFSLLFIYIFIYFRCQLEYGIRDAVTRRHSRIGGDRDGGMVSWWRQVYSRMDKFANLVLLIFFCWIRDEGIF